MVITNFNKRIKQERKARSLNQKEFAILCGVSQQTISRWESTDSPPDKQALLLVASRLQLNPDWLATGEGDKKITIGSEDHAPYAANPGRHADLMRSNYEAIRQQYLANPLSPELLELFSSLTRASQYEALAILHRLVEKDQQIRESLPEEQYHQLSKSLGATQDRGSAAVSRGKGQKKEARRKPA